MSAPTSLQISSRRRPERVSLDQQRFRYLCGEIAKARATREGLEASLLKFRQEHTARLQPLRASLAAVCRETVMAIDALIDQKGFSKADREALRSILCATAEIVLQANGKDDELRAVFDRHNEVHRRQQEDEIQRLKEEAEELMGVDFSDDDQIQTEEDLVQRMYEEMAAREAADESGRGGEAGQSHASKRSENNALLARQSLREIYRRLASAVHPDREPDPARRAEKNAMMQKINQAYASNDLLTLFEAQIELQQTDADAIDSLSKERLKQYNRLLSEQLNELKEETRSIEAGFCMDFDLPPSSGATPQTLARVIQRRARGLRAEIARQQEFLRLLGSKTAVKRWLKMQRQSLSFDDFDEG